MLLRSWLGQRMQFGHLKRREFITLLGGAAAWPLAARAQQGERIRKIGVLNAFTESDPEVQADLAAFWRRLQVLGWTEGRNVRIEHRWGGADSGSLRAQAKELVGLKPDVILAITALALQPLLEETRSIPIVFTRVGEPVRTGFVTSLARPGGNVTGFSATEPSMYGKLVEVLKEVAPSVTRVAVIYNPEQIPQIAILRAVEAAAPSFKVETVAAGTRNSADIGKAIEEVARKPNGGLIVVPNPVTERNRGMIIALAAERRLPAAYVFRHFVAEGGLISYGVASAEQYQQAAGYVDRILHGEKPGDLPVQLPTKFELAVNLKTARTLGLDVPATLLGRADEVIE
jgi:putative ABC transport system substrate-binding protein